MTPTRIGIAGCGQISLGVHLPILLSIRDVKITALADTDEGRLRAAASLAPGAATFRDAEELLARSDVDALLICLPNCLHASVAIAALNRRKHIYLEKPLGVTLQEGQAVLRAWSGTGVTAMVGFNYRFNKLYETARRVVRSGALGEIVAMRTVFSLPVHQTPEWKRSVAGGGGALFDLGSHHIDLVHHYFDCEIDSVNAETELDRGESATLELHLNNGVCVQSFFSLAAVEEDRIEVYGRAGKLSVDRHLSWSVQVAESTNRSARLRQIRALFGSLAYLPYLLEKRRATAFEPSYRDALTAFVSAARQGRSVKPDLKDGYRSLDVVRAALESANTGRRIRLLRDHEDPTA